MAENTSIEWCEHTFNAWLGCSKVATGCKFCYAEALATRFNKAAWGPDGTRVRTSLQYWKEPKHWNRKATNDRDVYKVIATNETFTTFADIASHFPPKTNRDMLIHESLFNLEQRGLIRSDAHQGFKIAGPYRPPFVFCASMSDLFEDWHGSITTHGGSPTTITMDELRKHVFELIDETPELIWLLLTKRPHNIRRMWPAYFPGGYIAEAGTMNQEGPRPNVWLGCSASTQNDLQQNVGALLDCHDLAPVRFLSLEPLIEAIDLRAVDLDMTRHAHLLGTPAWKRVKFVEWIIVGGESGPKARPFNIEWARSIRDQCKSAGVACFIKQLGSKPHCTIGTGHQHAEWISWMNLKDSKGGDMNEWPEDLRVRQIPKVEGAECYQS